jgi:alpha/beta hydrolase family protein
LSVDAATLSPEVPAGERGRPFTSATVDLGADDYVEEEWFLRGDARAYTVASGSALTGDGRWTVEHRSGQPFTTRLLVRRPVDRDRFDGTVVLEWLNVSGGIDLDPVWAQSHVEMLRAGNVWVGVSAQRAGVHGPPLMRGFSQPLEVWDAVRYRNLAVPDDDLSYGIFTAAAHAVRTGQITAGRAADVVIAAGASQSANRLVTYVNAVQRVERAIDAFLVHGRVGTSSPPLHTDTPMPDPLVVRTDVGVPVLVLESEFDILRSWRARQPDSERFRLWEVAGSTHQDEYVERTLHEQFSRDLGVEVPGCDCAVNNFPFHFVENAALARLRAWARGGSPAPAMPRVSLTDDGDVVRDEHGNALGGIRLAQVEVPTAQYGPVGTPESCALRGFVKPFTVEELTALYPDPDAYGTRVRAASDAAVAAGCLLAVDAHEAVEEALRALPRVS